MTAGERGKGKGETGLTRREVLVAGGAAAMLPLLDWSEASAERAARLTSELGGGDDQQFVPKFFTPHEWRTVRILVDYIIPRDERSGSATEAKVPEYMDFIFADRDTSDSSRVAMRGGLAWLDAECRRRHDATFAASTDPQRRAVLDDIAWPAKARPEMSQGVAFFTRMRDLTASGFFSSAMGYRDLDYRGNVFVPEWKGCPPEAMRKLGVSY